MKTGLVRRSERAVDWQRCLTFRSSKQLKTLFRSRQPQVNQLIGFELGRVAAALMRRKEESINTKRHVLGRDERSTAIRRLTNSKAQRSKQKGVAVITNKHLAIVRAALTFWDEEMASADESIYTHYLHSADRGTLITAIEVAKTRAYFNEIELKFALVENGSHEFLSNKPVDDHSELSRQPGQGHLVCVLTRRTDSDSLP